MKTEFRYLNLETLINLTLFFTIDNEDRYIIDNYDINRFWQVLNENLTKQNIKGVICKDKILSKDNFQVYKNEENGLEYYILYPWIDFVEFTYNLTGSISSDILLACHQNNLYQNLSPRSKEELTTLNQIYQQNIIEIEKENTKKHDFYNRRIKQIIKQKKRKQIS